VTNTGPPYPPQSTENGIGQFVIGVSPLGDIPAFNYWLTVISQYANSPILTAIIANWFASIDQTQNLDTFYDDIWNIQTAQGYGLDVWGRIVGVTRNLTIPSPTNWFGFEEAGATSLEFNQGTFYSGINLTSNFRLGDNAFRTLIYAKAMSNISNGSIHSINAILMTLFPNRGNAYVQDGTTHIAFFGFEEASPTSQPFNQAEFYNGNFAGGMTMVYTFNFPLQPYELAIVQTSGVMPKPSGVQASVLITA
jgi:Protein of unknown function (DUF2612)